LLLQSRAFAIACALGGATEVTAVESGKDNLPRIEANAALNGVSLKVVGADVFEFLSSAARRGEEYDLIILDPPPFTRTRKGIVDALRGYRELHLKAAQLLSKEDCSQPSPARIMSPPRNLEEVWPRDLRMLAAQHDSFRPIARVPITRSCSASQKRIPERLPLRNDGLVLEEAHEVHHREPTAPVWSGA